MTTDEQLTFALIKLRKLIDRGYLGANRYVGWSYDDNSERTVENRTLLKLSSYGVLRDVWAEMYETFLPDKNGILVTAEENFAPYDIGPGNLNEQAIIGGLNVIAYEHQCLRLGINPYNETYMATLSFEGMGQPLVTVGSERYYFASLHSGKKKELVIDVVKRHPDKLISLRQLKSLKDLQETLKSETNINTVLENSLFSKGKPLAPFFTITKDTIAYHPQQNLTIAQIETIKLHAKS